MAWTDKGYRCVVIPLLLVLASAAGAAQDSPAVPMVVDVVPGACPNHLRVDSPLTFAVGILGTEDLDVGTIVPATIRLSCEGGAASVAPLDHTYKDTGSPLIGGRCECWELVGDGLGDLVLYFDIRAAVAALGLGARVGETVPLIIRGETVTGRKISGVDCAVLIDADWADGHIGRELGFLTDAVSAQAGGCIGFAYFTDVSDHLDFVIYDLRGRAIARLVGMDLAPGIYRATWDGTDADSRLVAPGTYFARLSNSRNGETVKFQVPARGLGR